MKEKMTIILFSGELDKATAAFILATTAAASGMEVTIFFTFWGLNVLKRSRYTFTKSQGLMQKMFHFMSSSELPLSKLNMFGLGPWMMKKLMKRANTPSVKELMALAKQLGVKYIACTTSCGALGISRENLIEEVDEFAGAPTYLNGAREAKVNLFI